MHRNKSNAGVSTIDVSQHEDVNQDISNDCSKVFDGLAIGKPGAEEISRPCYKLDELVCKMEQKFPSIDGWDDTEPVGLELL